MKIKLSRTTQYILLAVLLFLLGCVITRPWAKILPERAQQQPQVQQKPLSAPSADLPSSTIDYSPATPNDNESINNQKNNSTDTTSTSSGEPIGAVLTAAGQDYSGGPVVIRVLVTGATTGVCNISLRKDGVTKAYSRDVINSGTYYSCAALDIPASDLPQGNWTLTVRVDSGDRSGSTSQEVTVVP